MNLKIKLYFYDTLSHYAGILVEPNTELTTRGLVAYGLEASGPWSTVSRPRASVTYAFRVLWPLSSMAHEAWPAT